MAKSKTVKSADTKAAKSSGRFDYTPRAEILFGDEFKNIYSQTVFWLKIILPAFAVALVLMIMVWPNFNASDNKFRISGDEMAATAPMASVIVGPRYVGSNDDGLNYSIRADAAAPVADEPNAINLKNLNIDVTFKTGMTAHMTAERATYWRNRNGMVAQGKIRVTTNDDHVIDADIVYADFAKGMIWSDRAVTGRSLTGDFAAEGFETDKTANRIKLSGRVKMHLQPRSQSAKLSAAGRP